MKTLFPALIILVFVGPVAAQQREPKYQGKPLSFWVLELQAQNYQTRAAAQKAIAAFGPRGKAAVIPVLIEMLEDLDPEFATFAAQLLGELAPLPEPAVAALEQLARNCKNKSTRSAAIDALGNADSPGINIGDITGDIRDEPMAARLFDRSAPLTSASSRWLSRFREFA